jgi:hypothetical protein
MKIKKPENLETTTREELLKFVDDLLALVNDQAREITLLKNEVARLKKSRLSQK